MKCYVISGRGQCGKSTCIMNLRSYFALDGLKVCCFPRTRGNYNPCYSPWNDDYLSYGNAFDSVELFEQNIPTGYDIAIVEFPQKYAMNDVLHNTLGLGFPTDILNEIVIGNDPIHEGSNHIERDSLCVDQLVSFDVTPSWTVPTYADISVGCYGWIPWEYTRAFPNFTWVSTLSELENYDFALIGKSKDRYHGHRTAKKPLLDAPLNVPTLSFYPPVHISEYGDAYPCVERSAHPDIWITLYDGVESIIRDGQTIITNGIVPLRGVMELGILSELGID